MIIVLSIIIILLLVYLICSQRKIYRDIDDFSEAIIYKDFSRRYPEKKGKNQKLYTQFNVITKAFLDLVSEKEAQQHYLKKILELVDTGILAYDIETHETLWMNDAFATMLNIPHIKNINWLKRQNERLFRELSDIPLNKSILMTIHAQKQTIKTMTNASIFETEGKTYKLIAFHNVSATMEEVESGAWKGLLNVMTHEIMNSIVPVTSLSDTLRKKIHTFKETASDLSNPDWEDMEFALDTIHRRSAGLLSFAETYQNLTQKIVPNMKLHNLYELINAVYFLMNPSLQQKGISFGLKTDNPDVAAYIDRDLIEQVIINFITNATNAVNGKEHPEIHLFSGSDTEGHPFITVADNGFGIPDDIRNNIFIPFFSTKKNGNGIGLSISREIVKLHDAEIHVQSEENQGSAFTILFSVCDTARFLCADAQQ
ncbi:two-component system nitrogen regulation sensor histidine kinase NtrY [Parabacteroides sp. PF5-5]|uniref:sensor histidine kinase n=1 Tax=unclassified Parabacteroides TaxID=2649774 RepID=UPI0024735CBC|nr:MULTISPECIES: ATP-binding protein [unclassified Parabacteroides]MDH6303501.1 two-component system nitrogen regulation sensor histidine kinase NtrY [Parabacteroides sp. PH5-39]MDH6314823.1 two-component system nitrogen regulation sensor histidine kinase NtrY [Parabacteroides sp. PF5-13]MDH6318160.1 two-component system nitrogen regulation sensor histidine kinase NtrY [Parabacteroides sp. PH5-13]MDH6321908.1 two-component system nitrogen regulation sensor histidine kinase NtrY [Parabacteroides